MHGVLPYSQACENNKAPILAILEKTFAASSNVLEVGSGTGQHAAFFAQNLHWLQWQASDQAIYLADLAERIRQIDLPNLPAPLPLDITKDNVPSTRFDALFTANTLHIMPWQVVETFFARLPQLLTAGSQLCIYGPFNYQGHFTSSSNAAFDATLKTRNALMGIRDIEAVQQLALSAGFRLQHDYAMPANNRLLHFTCIK